VEPGALENGFYRVRLDGNGDVASVFAKELGRELLAAPLRLEIKTDAPRAFPAWNMEWRDQARRPRHLVSAPARVRVRERGPARVALEIERRGEGSRFVQTVRLAAGEAGRRLEFADAVDWRTGAAHLKAVFPLAAGNPLAEYNLDVGVIRRPVNGPGMFEMAGQRWFDLSDAGGAFGVTVLSDCKYGSDRPDERTLRLTLLRTPAATGVHAHEATQDWGRHEFVYAVAAHAGDWRRAGTDRQAYRLNQPLLPFRSRRHGGFLGRRFSFLRLSHPGARVLALKKAEEGREIVVRIVESWGRGASGVRLGFAAPLLAVREVDGQERPLAAGGAHLQRGELVVDLAPFQLRSFAVTLAPPARSVGRPPQAPLPLAADVRIVARDGEKSAGGFDGRGRSLPAELFPAAVDFQGVAFRLRSADDPAGQAVACRGQEIVLPAGDHAGLLILAAAVGDRRAVFRVDGRPFELAVQDWGGFIGQWDRRLWQADASGQPAYAGLQPGFVKPAPVAWFAGHRHAADGGNEPYAYAYVFAHAIELDGPARSLRLPDDPRVRVLAVTAVGEDRALLPLWPVADGLPPGRP
jgi:alpha-mannosidase